MYVCIHIQLYVYIYFKRNTLSRHEPRPVLNVSLSFCDTVFAPENPYPGGGAVGAPFLLTRCY